jgi:NADP-dependent aldehyde dehydrogenase
MANVNQQVESAHTAWLTYRNWSQDRIVELLLQIAIDLDSAKSQLVPVAMAETQLTEVRLTGEVGRTTGQLRLMATAVRDSSYFDITIDHVDGSLTPPRPDLRMKSIPLGVVAIFGASNFPFAFGVAGGDTASALAAGCAVVIKVNPGHPKVSRMVAAIMVAAARAVGAPDGLISIVEDFEEGTQLVQHPLISAVAFTGSTHGGRALFDLANARENPIPFYGELGGLNPVFVTRAAASQNAKITAEGFLTSVTMGAGQFCTKPGFLVVDGATELIEELGSLVPALPGQKLLNESIKNRHDQIREEIAKVPGISLIARNESEVDTAVTFYHISASDFLVHRTLIQREVFGPTAVVIDCSGMADLMAVARSFSGTLTSGIHAIEGDQANLSELLSVLELISGRIIWNQWPTGLAVTWAMQHGGPYPASTNPLFTSVGAKALLRFRRPITYQNFPQADMPAPLQDIAIETATARINGVLGAD